MIDFDFAPETSHDRSSKEIPATGVAVEPISFDCPEEDLPDYLRLLNAEQKRAALTTQGPLIVLAGAGSGKTRMITSRITYLIEHLKVPAYQILAVTFTNKAAGEMKERIHKHLSYGSPEVGTFHSICVKILRKEMDRLPFNKNFTIYDDSDQKALIKSVMNKLNIDDKTFSAQSFQFAINQAKCGALEPHEMEVSPHSLFQKNAKRVYELYQKDLFESNAIDFGEIICLTYRLLRDHPDVRAKYQKRFQYIHVDEYQDTNRAQYLLLSVLAKSEFGGHQNICVVGDEDQSIYKWRGADINNILDFERDYPGAAVVKLEQNYRSTKVIITAASHLIKNNRQRKDKFLWTDNEEGELIERYQLADDRAEAELVVSKIKNFVQNQGDLNDVAIFYRTHAQSRQLEDLFRREKMSYQIVGGLRFYDRKEIKDILSYFKVILNPSDSVSLKRILNVPARGIGKTSIEKIEAVNTTTFWEALKNRPKLTAKTDGQIQKFISLIDFLSTEYPKLLLSELYHKILDDTGYVAQLKQEGTVEALARIENLEELDTLIQEYEEEVLRNFKPDQIEEQKANLLPVFLERTSLITEESKNVDFSSIKMMTLHSSKGLEFPVVFMVGLEEGLFPSIRSEDGDDPDEIEEERRLCYVGMTRAREKLFMTHCVCRRIWGNVNYQDPARFFNEIPDEYIQFKDLSLGVRSGVQRSGYFDRW